MSEESFNIFFEDAINMAEMENWSQINQSCVIVSLAQVLPCSAVTVPGSDAAVAGAC